MIRDLPIKDMAEIDDLINKFNLKPHPEGGYYSQAFVSGRKVCSKLENSSDIVYRSALTSIYFLLVGEQVSKFHRLKSDEIWYFFRGSSVSIHVIDRTGNYQIKKLGSDFRNNDLPQQVVEAGNWFGATLNDKAGYAFVGCAVAPGFEFEDFELAERKTLLKSFPEHKNIVKKLT